MSVVGVQSRHSACTGYDAITTCRVPDVVQPANAALQSGDRLARRAGWAPDRQRTADALRSIGARSPWTLALLLYGSLGRASQLAQPAFRGSIGFRGRLGLPAHNLSKRSEKLTRQFLRRSIDQPLAKLRQLAADLGVDLIMQDRDLRAFVFQPNGGAAL